MPSLGVTVPETDHRGAPGLSGSPSCPGAHGGGFSNPSAAATFKAAAGVVTAGSARSIFDHVRDSCRSVAESASLVSINHGAIAAYAAAIPVAEAQAAAAADRVAEAPSEAETSATIAHVFAAAGISFTSGWHDVIRKRPGMSGAVSMIARLDNYIAATGPLTSDRLRALTPTDTSQIFEQELDGGAIEELIVLLAATLNELGELAANLGGFQSFVETADGKADRLVRTLGQMPSWHDVAQYRFEAEPRTTVTVCFYKRAQMAVASLHRTLHGDGLGAFDDLDQLTIFADNLVPHVLRVDGLLDYDPELLLAIERGELLATGSSAEIEIRACGVHAAELIATALRSNTTTPASSKATPLSPADLDNWLWSRGASARYKASPRHRCRNRFY